MKKLIYVFILIIGLSCNEKTDSKKQSENSVQLSDLKKENDSLKLELEKYKIQSTKILKLFLTNNSAKYWIVNSINGRNIENAQTRIVWKFDDKNNYHIYSKSKSDLIKNNNGDERYSNTFKIISYDQILLDGYKQNIKKLSTDTLEIENNDRLYLLIPYELK